MSRSVVSLSVEVLLFFATTAYPLQLTLSALTSQPERLRPVLSFWAMLAVVTTGEELLHPILYLLPLTWRVMKLLFVGWCCHPSCSGALFLFESYALPLLPTEMLKGGSKPPLASVGGGEESAVLAKARAFVQRSAR